MQKLNIKHDTKIKMPAPLSELTRERREIIEHKVKSALLRALLAHGGEVVFLKPTTTNEIKPGG